MIRTSTRNLRTFTRTLKLTVLAVLLSGLLPGSLTQAQLLYNENFNVTAATNSLPLGWSQGKYGAGTDADNYWDRVIVGANPAATPRGGTGAMMRYRSWYTVAGEASFLASKRFAMNGTGVNAMPGGGANFSFWFWRDNSAFLAFNDRIQVYVNDSAVITGGANGATLLTETGTSSTEINRSTSLLPAGAAGWNQYFYNIANVAPYNGASVYVMILAISADGNNMYVDDFSITSYPATQNYTASSAGVFNQNSSTTAPNQLNQQIIGCKLTMSGALSPRTLTNMEFNTNGSTNPPTDIGAAKLYFTGGSNTFDITTATLLGTYNQPWATNYMFLTAPNANYTGLTSFSGLEHGDNYFWILYDIPSGAISGNFVDADWINFTMSGSGAITPNPQTYAGSREIDLVYCIPTYWVGTIWLNYVTNDFVNSVTMAGNTGAPPGVNNNQNWILTPAGVNCPAPAPRFCPFQTHPPDYELFSQVPGKTAQLTADGTTAYFISLQVGTYGGGNAIAAFIDYNRDGDFFDAGEKIAQSGSLGALGTYTTSFTVPISAVAGKTRMRVREVWIDYNIDPCNTRTYGETEDYVITIIPDCPGYPGYTTWLGLSDQWQDPSNWCPAVAPINGNPIVNVRIPGGPSGAYPYNRPVIRGGVQAVTNKLRIEANDTLYIDATASSYLTVNDSMKIWTPTSALKINTTFEDSAQVFNGALNRPADSPLNNYNRSRSFIAIPQVDLLSQGLQAGDIITNVLVHIQRKSNGNPYKNLTVKMYLANNASTLFGTGYTAVIPPPIGTVYTVFSGDVDASAFVPVANGYGTIDLLLTTPYQWLGGTNVLVVEMCYDNIGFPTTGSNDEPRFTQTTSLRRYMSLRALTDFPKAGCSLVPGDVVTFNGTWLAGTNTITIVSGTPDIRQGQLSYIDGRQVTGFGGSTITMNSNAFVGGTNVAMTFANVQNTSIFYRPNLTFKFTRPYIKYPVAVKGHWENNGLFVPAVSRVTLNGIIVNQKVDGVSNTEFYDLDISNGNHVIRYSDFTVTDSLRLLTGRLKLNNGLVTLTNPAISALTRTNGFIQAEMDVLSANASPYGRIRWQMGTATGLRILPFVSSTGVYLPLDYNVDAGTHDVMIGTYSTLQDNTNLPSPEVTNILGVNNAVGGGWGTGGWAMVDRYYHLDNSAGLAGQADITFRYAYTEQAQAGNTNMRAQRWINTTDLWEFPYQPSQNFTAGAINNLPPNVVTLPNFAGFESSTWWTIVGESNPLPISLLDFRAQSYKDKVKLMWTTASEINNSHFEIERTVDNSDFTFIGRAESKGPGNNLQDYVLWDNNPVEGTQYYYLQQHDFDGRMERFGPVSATFSNDVFDIVTTAVSPTDMGVTVVFNYNSTEPYSYRIMDMTGRVIVAKDRNTAVEGLNVIDIDASLAKGAYHIILQNSSKVVSKKFFY